MHLSTSPSIFFLLLILHQLNIILRNDTILLQQKLLDLLTHISLHHDLLSSARHLRYTRSRCKLLTQILSHFLVFESEGFEAADGGDEFPLVALHALDYYLGGGDGGGLFGFCGFGFQGFFVGVFFGAFASFEGEG